MKPKKHPSKISTVIPIRVSNEQLAALRTLPAEVSISAVARALFQAYLSGSLPTSIYEDVEREALRTREAVRGGQKKIRKESQHGKQQQQGRAAERVQSLRETLLLKFRELREGDAA